MNRRPVLLSTLVISAGLLICSCGSGGPEAIGERVAQTSAALCSAGTLTASPSLAPAGSSVQLNASASCQFPSPQYEFWIEDPLGNWTSPAGYTPSSSYAWQVPAGANNGDVYQMQAWARESGSSAPYEAVGSTSFTVGTVTPCTAGTLSASPVEAPAGVSVQFTGGASCSLPSPNYEFWIEDPLGNWTTPAGYTTARPYGWQVPAGAHNGDVYQVQVWVRESTSGAPYEATADLTFTVGTLAPCSNGTLSASPSEAPAGASVQLTGSATCQLPNPQYEFWVGDPLGNWTSPTGYTTSSSYAWQVPAGAHNGDVYQLQLWAREQGSSASYEAVGSTSVTVGVMPPCTNGSLAASPLEGPAGSSVQLTGSASCSLPNPQYEFWVEDPLGNWTSPTGYTTSGSYSWQVPAGAHNGDVYQLQVWVREGGSAATYEATANQTFTVGTLTPCSGASLNLNPQTALAGATVTVSGSATCQLANPQYEFWVEDPLGNWTTPAGYTTSSMYSWQVPSGAVAGQVYSWQVWVREAGSPAAYETTAQQAFTVGCSGTETSAGCLVILATARNYPYGLAVNSSSAFWTETGGGTVNSVPLAGGTPGTLASGGTNPLAIAIDSSSVYWTDDGNGTVMKTGLTGGTATTLSSGGTNPAGLAIDLTSVYWTDNGKNTVMKAPLGGGSASTLASAQGPLLMAVDSASVYWADNTSGNLLKVALGGGTPTTLASGQSSPYDVVVDSASAYWTDYAGGTVMKVALGGGTPVTLASGQSSPIHLAVDSANLYWTNYTGGTVMKVAVAGGTATTLASGQGAPMGITVDSSSVYWTVYTTTGSVSMLTPK